jgi:hypothetical protein
MPAVGVSAEKPPMPPLKMDVSGSYTNTYPPPAPIKEVGKVAFAYTAGTGAYIGDLVGTSVVEMWGTETPSGDLVLTSSSTFEGTIDGIPVEFSYQTTMRISPLILFEGEKNGTCVLHGVVTGGAYEGYTVSGVLHLTGTFPLATFYDGKIQITP